MTLLNNQRSRSAEGHKRLKAMNSILPDSELYMAVKSYDPSQFSRSGHANLELPLNEGDNVRLLGMLMYHLCLMFTGICCYVIATVFSLQYSSCGF